MDRYLNLMEASADGIVVVDTEGVALYANPAAERIFEKKQEEIVGGLFGFPVHTGEGVEIRIVAGDGSLRTAELRSAAVQWQGDDAHLVNIRDITRLKAAEDALRERLKEQTCLHAVSRLVAEPLDSLDETLAAIAAAIPPGWQYPAITGARITLEDRAVATDGFAETDWQLSAEIAAGGTVAGTVDVCYRERRPPADEGPFLAEERALLNDIARHIGVLLERERAVARQALHAEVLAVLNRHGDWPALLRDLLVKIKAFTGCDAAGIRLADGEDFPYYEQNGFADDFIEQERCLCVRDDEGTIAREPAGAPVLACMCGAVIRGDTDPARPFFTAGGSFWTNSTTALLAETAADDRVARARNRCCEAGYESVALVPLRSDEETIGLLQINDRRPGRFSPDLIAFFEEIGDSIGVAYARMMAEEVLRENEEKLNILFDSAPDAYYISDYKGIFIDGNKAAEEMIGYPREEMIGKSFLKAGLLSLKDVPRAAASLAKNVVGRTAGPEEYTLKRSDGSRVEVEIRTHPVKIHGKSVILGIARDITHRKRQQDELDRHRDHLEELVEEKTRDLQRTVNLMAGREIRMAELKQRIAALERQLTEAGIEPAAEQSTEISADD